MTAQNAPIIIKRKKIVAGGGHHGGAWKVAYADFVTAMMAFFMLMWLLNATTEQQRKGLADYFAPTIAISRTSGGGADVLNGDTLSQSETLRASDLGAAGPLGLTPEGAVPTPPGEGAALAEVAALRDIEEILLGRGGESLVAREALRHVVTRLTDEGLVIEIFARPGAPIFAPGDTVPLPVTDTLLGLVAQAASLVENEVAVAAHLAARPVVLADNPIWSLSSGRAEAARRTLEAAGLAPARMARVTGLGDRSPAPEGPAAPRSDRIEITLLRRH
ncbi:flagellar motor protein MotB [Limimaricola sp.]|uniref:flagellar motor protein MotB n=1 Tax=Limimaricola sp. TaxID=2211665 RepID=UPI0040589E2C